MTPAVLFLSEDADDIPWMQELVRGLALHLSSGADFHRAAGRTELADALDAASIRFDPSRVN